MIYENQTIQETVKDLRQIALYAPYKYGGKWFLAMIGEDCVVFRATKPIKTRAIKAGMQSIAISEFG